MTTYLHKYPLYLQENSDTDTMNNLHNYYMTVTVLFIHNYILCSFCNNMKIINTPNDSAKFTYISIFWSCWAKMIQSCKVLFIKLLSERHFNFLDRKTIPTVSKDHDHSYQYVYSDQEEVW